MKLFFILFLLFISISCNSTKIEYYKDANGIMNICHNGIQDSLIPYTGQIISYYSNGKRESEFSYKDGKEDGLFTQWYEDGQKKQEGTSKDGEWNGLLTSWWENGQKSSEINYKNDIIINIKGRWDQDGSIRWTINSPTK